jgi:Zn-dependent protease
MLGSPDATPYDLRFNLFRIPVRVHPLFWLIMAILGSSNDDLQGTLVFVVCAFFSVLVHELGHGLSSRLLGEEPLGIVLYAAGGLCLFNPNGLSRWRRIVVLLCGPGAGFLLLGAVVAWHLFGRVPTNPVVHTALIFLIYINLFWGLLNLLPLWPLDGGQIVATLLPMISSRHGLRWAHVISLLTGGGLAVWRFSAGDYWLAFWFAMFAVMNFQRLQALQHVWSHADDPDYWRR